MNKVARHTLLSVTLTIPFAVHAGNAVLSPSIIATQADLTQPHPAGPVLPAGVSSTDPDYAGMNLGGQRTYPDAPVNIFSWGGRTLTSHIDPESGDIVHILATGSSDRPYTQLQYRKSTCKRYGYGSGNVSRTLPSGSSNAPNHIPALGYKKQNLCEPTSSGNQYTFTDMTRTPGVHSLWFTDLYFPNPGDSQNILGFIHEERFENTGGTSDTVAGNHGQTRLGLAKSSDWGQTWTYLGRIVAPFENTTGVNIQGSPYLIVNDGGVDYLYVYYKDVDNKVCGEFNVLASEAAAARNEGRDMQITATQLSEIRQLDGFSNSTDSDELKEFFRKNGCFNRNVGVARASIDSIKMNAAQNAVGNWSKLVKECGADPSHTNLQQELDCVLADLDSNRYFWDTAYYENINPVVSNGASNAPAGLRPAFPKSTLSGSIHTQAMRVDGTATNGQPSTKYYMTTSNQTWERTPGSNVFIPTEVWLHSSTDALVWKQEALLEKEAAVTIRKDNGSTTEAGGYHYCGTTTLNGAPNHVTTESGFYINCIDLDQKVNGEKLPEHFAMYRWKYDLNVSSADYHRSSKGFDGVQGPNWEYMWAKDSVIQGHMNFSGGYWKETDADGDGTIDPWNRIYRDAMHPGSSSSPILRWTAPRSGIVDISGVVRDSNPRLTCAWNTADGIKVAVVHESDILLAETIKNGDTVGYSIPIADGSGGSGPGKSRNVNQGDRIYFMIEANENNYCDSTKWDPTIMYVD